MRFMPPFIERVLWKVLASTGSSDASAIPVLLYHAVDGSGSVGSVEPALLRRQLEFLSGHGYVGLKCSDVFSSLLKTPSRKSEMSASGVALTFDDAYASFAGVVLPLLKEFGFTATVFPVVEKIGGVSDWGRLAGVPARPLMDWSELKDAVSEGIEVGSHGLTHRYLPELPLSELAREIKESKDRLEQALGVEVSTFCYPYGAYNETVQEMVRHAGYLQSCAMNYDICGRRASPMEMPRIAMDIFRYSGERDMWIFPACLNGGARAYVKLRGILLREPKRYDRP
jgi:peptidoglycan/xylan/chitin deacetylase (PgdA/CDA1 family)